MAKQTIQRTSILPLIASTLTAGTYPSTIIAVNTSGFISQLTENVITSSFAVSVSGAINQVSAITYQSTTTVDLVERFVSTQTTVNNLTSMTVDAYGRVTAYETTASNIIISGNAIFPSSITVNTSGYITRFANFTTVTSVSLSSPLGHYASMGATLEKITTTTGATGVVVHDFNLGNQWTHNNVAGNFTANFTNIPTTAYNMINMVLILNQGATPYIPNAVQINGVGQTIKWFAASAPTGTANKTEFFTFSLINTASNWIVLGSKASYG